MTIPSLPLRVPDASILRPYVARGFRLWLIVRIAAAVVPVLTQMVPPAEVLRWNLPGAVGMVVACAILGFVDTRRRGERAMIGNLGISDRELVTMFVAPATVGEIVLAVILPW